MELIIFPPTYGEPAGSPFATKVIGLLEYAKLDYKLTHMNNPSSMPKKKLPVLKVNDRLIADSNDIKTYLEQTHGIDFDEGLDARERAISHSITKMIEENLYFIVYASRWMEEENWQVTKAANFGGVPALMRGFITRMVRKGAVAQVIGQGMGRHSKAERLKRFEQDVLAVETILGDQDFLFGNTPCSADISTVTALRFCAAFTGKNDLSDFLHSRPKIMAYLNRGKEAFYPK